MFSKYGRIFSIDVGASKTSKFNQYWVSIFRTLRTDMDMLMESDMHVNHGYVVSKSSVNRLRRAQDKLMEGKHE